MPELYGGLKRIYKRVVPPAVQELTWSRQYPFWRVFEPAKAFLRRGADHNEIYDRFYFEETVEGPIAISAPVIGRYIIETFAPRSVIDVGCGTGALLEYLQSAGIECLGLEHADAAIEIAKERGVAVRKVDIEKRFQLDGRWDLAVSTEVAEHLPEACADIFVDLLGSLSDRVLMTAATPGQGGTDHVNEQPHEYWIDKFNLRGFGLDESATLAARESWEREGAADFYFLNAMVFTAAASRS